MKVSTVSIVMAILCTLSSWRSAKGGDTIAIAANNSSAIALSTGSYGTGPNAVVPKPSTPSNGGSSSGSNGGNPETDKIETTTMSNSKWREELERRLAQIYQNINEKDLGRLINDLMSAILETLVKTDIPEGIGTELYFALKILIKASNEDYATKKAAFNQALCKLFGILYGGGKPDKIETTTMSNSKWREELERRLAQIYQNINEKDLGRLINDLMSAILVTLAKADVPEAIRAELNFALKILIKASNEDYATKKAAFNQALCKLFGILYGGGKPDKIETTTMSYSKWGDDLLRALDEIYKAMERDNLDRDINALISLIEEYLAKAGASGATTAELDYCLKILIKANGSIDVTVKNSAYNNAFCTLIRIVKE
ncbi:uncharacterized protein LOC105233797 isoform X1 [Bactrocera dorsalis]|uniref:Uncharacterized protein LOC105233797 isoform X1 n=1 Tax=Bactrocera dorsalis TaxID=27457 RepID=A0ABM3J299_BACDO|nr:uncharacterized protein LOC105233797 isoform X1 [Bactrocera dorsalis]